MRITLFLLATWLATPTLAAISGQVRDRTTDLPLQGIQVRLQAVPDSPVAITGADGRFTLAAEPVGQVTVAAAKPYDHSIGAINYATDVALTFNGASNVLIRLPRSPDTLTTPHTVQTSSQCGGCHNMQRGEWQESRHAIAASNAWVLDLYSGTGTAGGAAGFVFTNTRPDQSGFCATCHAPMQDVFTPGLLKLNEVSSDAGRDGVNCLACHQIANVDANQINGLHHVSKTAYRFPNSNSPNTNFHVFGPLPDVDDTPMRNIYSPLFQQPLLCASCHQYANPSNGLVAQNTYGEWLESPFSAPGPSFRACQDCHMPNATESGILASGSSVERPASQIHSHRIVGSTESSLRAAIKLRLSSRIQGNQLVVIGSVDNVGAGHAFPGGVSIRNAILLLSAQRGSVALTQSGGPVVPNWASDDVAGVQAGDLGGLPGTGFAKILRGRINGTGPQVEPVLFIDAESIAENSLIGSGSTRVTEVRFTLPPKTTLSEVNFSAKLIWRRAFRALSVSKGWTTAVDGGPIEIEIDAQTRNAERLFRSGFE